MKTRNGFLIASLALSALYFIFLLLCLFNVFDVSGVINPNFNYFLAFSLIIVCLALYVISLFIEEKRKLSVPTWLACSFYLSFFLFTNIYYFFGLYSYIFPMLIFYIALGVLISILSLSVYYNNLKELNGTLANKNNFIGYVLFAISISISTLIAFVINLVKYLINQNINITVYFLSSFGLLILSAFVFAILFTLSINRKKKFANACLIVIKR